MALFIIKKFHKFKLVQRFISYIQMLAYAAEDYRIPGGWV